MAYTNSTIANYISLYGAVKKDGTPINFISSPLLQDLTTQDLVWVKLANVVGFNGVTYPTFELMFNKADGLSPSVIYLLSRTGFSTITHFIGMLIDNGGTMPLTRYDNLIAIDHKDISGTSRTTASGVSVLLNPQMIVPDGRRYLASTNSTVISMKLVNRLVATKFEVRGNQTIAGTYSYAYTSS